MFVFAIPLPEIRDEVPEKFEELIFDLPSPFGLRPLAGSGESARSDTVVTH
jgi:hypothetical protein